MSRAKHSPVERYHDRVAARYDHSYDDPFWQWHDALTWDYLKPFLPRDQRAAVVDLGCGTGTWAIRLVKSGYAVTCVDISHRMLDVARTKVERQAALHRATFVRADLSDLSALPAEHFALAIALGDPIGFTPSPARTLKQIARRLRPGGVLVATFDNRLAAIDYFLAKGDPRTLARFLRDGKTQWLTDRPEDRFEITTYAPSPLTALVQRAGFDVLDLVGKTVLPMRRYRGLLETAETRRTWARIEKQLSRNPDAMGLASHLQIACRRRETPAR